MGKVFRIGDVSGDIETRNATVIEGSVEVCNGGVSSDEQTRCVLENRKIDVDGQARTHAKSCDEV